MRVFRLLNLAILSVLVASSAAVYAQDEKQQEEKPRQEEPKRQDQARPESRQDEMKPSSKDEAKPPKEGKQEPKREEDKQREEMKSGRQEPGREEGHGRPATKSAHIPDDKFRTQFGRGHTFRVQRPVTVEGGQGFFYGGYSFLLVDTWPAEWAYTDDCYVDYIDGEYFLFDMLHPGVRIAVMVVM
jgi:hemolysin activation/secretion protein